MTIGNAEIKVRLELEEAKIHVLIPSVMKYLISVLLGKSQNRVVL